MTLLAVNIGNQLQFANGQGVNAIFPNIGKFISVMIQNVYILASIILLFLLIFGGLGIIMGAGNSDPKQAEQGKQAATYAVVGFLVIFMSFWIIKIIEALTGLQILNSTL